MRIHWQNLTEHLDSGARSIFKHGRAWLHRSGDHHTNSPSLRLEWNHGDWTTHAEIAVERESREVTLSWAIPGMSYYLTVDNIPAALFDRLPFSHHRDGSYSGGSRRTGITVHDGSVAIALWNDDMMHKNTDPWWYRKSFRISKIADVLFGKPVHEARKIEQTTVVIPLPEAAYPATATRLRVSRTRPRWPWWPLSTVRGRTRIEIEGDGIPIPGKGENDYDMDNDTIQATNIPFDSIPDAIASVITSVLSTRDRYGWP